MADNSNQHKGDQNNPRNQDAGLFKRLTRLFSGPLVDYNQPAVTRTTARTVTKYKFTTASGKEFKKEEYHNPFSSLQAKVFLNRDKQLRYTDFDQMEYMPEIASALDVYADEITTSSELTSLVHVECHNREIKEIIHTLLYTVLNIESNLFGWARSMCKYGDYFLYLDVDDTLGITNVIPLPVREVERLEGKDPTNPNYVQYYWSGDAQPGVTFENWQLAHFRVLGNDKYVPYGTSVLEPSRRIWRQLTLLEDAMMAYRIVRSPERRVFYIDVGNIPAEDVEQYIEQVKTQMKRNQIVDQDTGRVDLRYNAMSIDEDYYIPVRAGNSSRIETLAGGSFTGDIEDVQYLRDKLFSALKVPKAYLAQSDSMEDKTTLAQKDIRFARTIQRLQRVVISEIEKMCIIHLYTLGYRNADLTNFKLTLNNPSKIAELQELEHLRSRFEIAGVATDGYFSKRWVYKNIFKLDDDEIERMQFEQYTDSKHAAAIESMGTAAGEAATAMAGGGEGGDLGDEDLGGDDLGSDDLGDDSTEESPEEEGPLLAEPGQRNDNGYETVKLDGRRGGARLRSYLASAGESVGSSSDRNLFKGWSGEMKPLSRGIVGESMRSEEKLIRETSNDILNLISDLGKNNED
jgi:hypothetical protein|tara:strand:- start:2236 stop:4128 length:1893 start_codon:yes stop_codon:yes gene_type:complete